MNDLLSQTIKNINIVIVDNFSPNNSFNELKKSFSSKKNVFVLKTDKNGGFSYGNNFGIKFALEKLNPDFFLLINNDTRVENSFLEKLLECYKNNFKKKDLGVVVPKIYYYSNKDIIWYAGGYFSKFRCSGYHYGINKKDAKEFSETKLVTFGTGCCWFFKKDLINKVGFLPEEYFLYVEDVDFSLKIQKKGGSILYCPTAKMWHKIGNSTGFNSISDKSYKLLNRNRIILAKKYLNLTERVIFYSFLFSSRVIRFIQFLLKGKVINVFGGIKEGFKYKNK